MKNRTLHPSTRRKEIKKLIAEGYSLPATIAKIQSKYPDIDSEVIRKDYNLKKYKTKDGIALQDIPKQEPIPEPKEFIKPISEAKEVMNTVNDNLKKCQSELLKARKQNGGLLPQQLRMLKEIKKLIKLIK